ncbi:hypothetical protein SISSUDRAFT_1063133 [Sistotremastrum suecicum HHB10207 ss-3]|uniref:Uncharacterized protein n=1 Tax=Sistotremastrum suecicum HHB10207 ss-3 TaxID=1314776 RepID=A0A166C5V0_9AGAM|nr:hypothetical protein SISSUDRAFT_1063133 [Sistotremastrum suecicum HHB10207 ss-3]
MAHRLQRLHDGCGNLWESSKGLSKKRKIANSAHTFAEGLLHHGKGFPLWSPNPIDAVVCVADVGIINERGRFEIFFNILLSRPQHGFDEQSPGVYSLPEGFPPFEFEPLSGETPVHVDPLPENKLFMDRSRREFGASMDASSGGLGVLGGGFSFSTERSSGAALFTSHSITYDLNRKYETKLKNHLIKYSSWWENYVSQEHEGLRLSDIVIVTGCYNTRNWAVAAFDNSRSSARIKFQVQDEIGLSVWGSWEATQSIDTKAGPDRRCETPSRRPVPWIEPSQYADCDQNVFLKGLRFTTRSSFFSLRLKAGAGPHLLPRDHNDSEGEPSLTIANFPSLDKGHSLHDELMEHYFMKTEADIVIIDHDEMAIASAVSPSID